MNGRVRGCLQNLGRESSFHLAYIDSNMIEEHVYLPFCVSLACVLPLQLATLVLTTPTTLHDPITTSDGGQTHTLPMKP